MTQRPSTLRHRIGVYRDAVMLVEAEYDRELRLDDVAHRVASSRRQLQRCYEEIGATTFREHLTAVRMRRAAELLGTGAISVREAARRVGYRQPGQFAKAFCRHHGISPSLYRTRARAQRSDGHPPTVQDGHATVAGRVAHVLALLDRDRDGTVDASDIEEWVDRLGAIRGWEPGHHAYTTLTRLFVERSYRALQATTGRPDGRVTLPALRDAVIATAHAHPERLAAWAHALYDLLDAERSGSIGIGEYRSLLASLSIANDAADIAFARIDHRARGRLSRAQFIASYLQFFLDAAPDTPAAWFWGGPLSR